MNNSPDFPNTLQSNSVESTCDRFRDAWKGGGRPRIEEFLGTQLGDNSTANRDLLIELVKIDLEFRWREELLEEPVQADGPPDDSSNSAYRPLPSRPRLADYVERFPALGPVAQLPTQLVVHEYILRRSKGDAAETDDSMASTDGGAKLAAAFASIDQATRNPPSPQRDAGETDSFREPGSPSGQAGMPERIGRYKPECELGSGGFGTVYRCRDEQLERDVAVKLFNGAAAERFGQTDDFLHEAKTAARVRHPGVVAVLDAGRTEDGKGFVVYELVRGSTLKDRVAAQPVGRDKVVRWLIEMAEALHAAHKCGIVHRDVKPANILIDEQEKARLADFGIAKLDDRFFLNDKGEVVGTIAYMSPEQADGQSHWASPQSDIYSLGTVMYELLCDRTPFCGENWNEVRQQILGRAVQPPRTIDDTIPQELEAVCLKALAKKQEDRFKTAADMAAALRAAVVPHGPQAIVLGLAVAAVLGLAAGGLWLFGPWRSIGQPLVPSIAPAGNNLPKTAGTELSAVIEDVCNEHPAFRVTVEVNSPDRKFRGGEAMCVKVVSERDGYLYLLYRSADGDLSCLFPNKHQRNNGIFAGKPVIIPSLDSGFNIRMGPPYGVETLKAIVLTKPLPADVWGVDSLIDQQRTVLTDQGVKGAVIEVRQRKDWAEEKVRITTVPPEGEDKR